MFFLSFNAPEEFLQLRCRYRDRSRLKELAGMMFRSKTCAIAAAEIMLEEDAVLGKRFLRGVIERSDFETVCTIWNWVAEKMPELNGACRRRLNACRARSARTYLDAVKLSLESGMPLPFPEIPDFSAESLPGDVWAVWRLARLSGQAALEERCRAYVREMPKESVDDLLVFARFCQFDHGQADISDILGRMMQKVRLMEPFPSHDTLLALRRIWTFCLEFGAMEQGVELWRQYPDILSSSAPDDERVNALLKEEPRGIPWSLGQFEKADSMQGWEWCLLRLFQLDSALGRRTLDSSCATMLRRSKSWYDASPDDFFLSCAMLDYLLAAAGPERLAYWLRHAEKWAKSGEAWTRIALMRFYWLEDESGAQRAMTAAEACCRNSWCKEFDVALAVFAPAEARTRAARLLRRMRSVAHLVTLADDSDDAEIRAAAEMRACALARRYDDYIALYEYYIGRNDETKMQEMITLARCHARGFQDVHRCVDALAGMGRRAEALEMLLGAKEMLTEDDCVDFEFMLEMLTES